MKPEFSCYSLQIIVLVIFSNCPLFLAIDRLHVSVRSVAQHIASSFISLYPPSLSFDCHHHGWPYKFTDLLCTSTYQHKVNSLACDIPV
jgi:hypothetical protein